MGELETLQLFQAFHKVDGFEGRLGDSPPQARHLRSMMIVVRT